MQRSTLNICHYKLSHICEDAFDTEYCIIAYLSIDINKKWTNIYKDAFKTEYIYTWQTVNEIWD